MDNLKPVAPYVSNLKPATSYNKNIVELPCNIGDYAYVITIRGSKYVIVKAEVTSFKIDETGISEVELMSETTIFDLFVESVYLSLSEAKKALKVLEQKSSERG